MFDLYTFDENGKLYLKLHGTTPKNNTLPIVQILKTTSLHNGEYYRFVAFIRLLVLSVTLVEAWATCISSSLFICAVRKRIKETLCRPLKLDNATLIPTRWCRSGFVYI